MELNKEEKKRFDKITRTKADKKELIKKIVSLRVDGMSFRNIGIVLNVPKSSVYKYFEDNNGNK